MRRVLPVCLSLLVLAGCGKSLSDVPLPSEVSGPTYELDAVFDSALNLPRQAPVKVDGRTVGQVESVKAVDYTAHVRMTVSKDTRLPVGTRAEVRLSAPVGEAFVALTPPAKASAPVLKDGDVIQRDDTGTAPDTTDLLTGLSTAVTGGSYADLKVVVEELVKAFDGRGKDVRTLVKRLDRFVTTVNDRRDEIDAALDGLDRLSAHLAADTDSLAASTASIAPAVRQLAAQQDDAMRMVTSLTKLGDAGSDVIERTRSTIGQQVRDLDAVLKEIVAAQESIGPILTGVQAFADGLDRATPGDYAMFDLTILANPYLGGDLPLTNLVKGAGPDPGPPPLKQLAEDLTSPTGPLSSLLGILGKGAQR